VHPAPPASHVVPEPDQVEGPVRLPLVKPGLSCDEVLEGLARDAQASGGEPVAEEAEALPDAPDGPRSSRNSAHRDPSSPRRDQQDRRAPARGASRYGQQDPAHRGAKADRHVPEDAQAATIVWGRSRPVARARARDLTRAPSLRHAPSASRSVSRARISARIRAPCRGSSPFSSSSRP